jgi:MOSC domain-containing protein YiiM
MTSVGRLVSINVSLPREAIWHGGVVLTSIFKTPVIGTVAVTATNLEGDRQSDLTVHGGPRKAVYVYPYEHYAFWRGELPHADLGFGAFGENLTTEGLLETAVSPGDVLEIGTVAFHVTVPRLPCFKLGIRFDRADMIKRFWRSGRCGFYLAVDRAGKITAGDPIRITRASRGEPTIAEVFARRGQSVSG